ncbi:spore protease YyaC [Alkalihalobacillus sp. MEB130]|uniref:spore protease YyaC n=1 Tax=Alkalihalobacillus sp. MEB130 TaxID=2976704 RepID=UPI0028DF4249|nr:spore protease YyaC [Alkalihalobacillus sp. MEB130]MDT8859683.1 spore protease YyaC [Alkalihalobacillus sp. MEB130]
MFQQQALQRVITPSKMIIPYDHKLAPLFIRNKLFSLIPEGTEHIYVAGIGSSLINGDSLGPFVGTLLHDMYSKHLTVLGSLQSPLDATTIEPVLSQLNVPENSFVIAIDSVLGPKRNVNSIVIREGSILPGEGLGQVLPPIGDCSIMGVVLEDNPALESSLFYTNLHLIYTMASTIARGISLTTRQYFHYPSDHPILHNL